MTLRKLEGRKTRRRKLASELCHCGNCFHARALRDKNNQTNGNTRYRKKVQTHVLVRAAGPEAECRIAERREGGAAASGRREDQKNKDQRGCECKRMRAAYAAQPMRVQGGCMVVGCLPHTTHHTPFRMSRPTCRTPRVHVFRIIGLVYGFVF